MCTICYTYLYFNFRLSFIVMLFLQTHNSLFITTNIDLLAHPNLDGEVSGSSQGQNKDFKIVLTALQHVLVIITLSRGNAIAKKKAQLIPYTNGPLQIEVV